MKRLFILGVNGNARDIVDAVRLLRARDPSFPEIGGFLDDKAASDLAVDGVPVIGPIARARELADAVFVNAIGSPESYGTKLAIIERTGVPESAFISVIHPAASASPSAIVGPGSVLLASTVLGSGVRVGRHVMILQACVISHDATIADFSVLATGVLLSGGVRVGRNAYLGSGCSVRGAVRIGEGSLVGMGAVVLEDVPSGETWAGNPARCLRTAA
ncbi:MAG: NeuD/PglB/VioB family sugar acetyltransferase [Verrucomicrobiae bacterium]|nr:NeuD/PglB/VioB family sugar acetyltransferase [Verrucomicrobiae bacterium]